MGDVLNGSVTTIKQGMVYLACSQKTDWSTIVRNPLRENAVCVRVTWMPSYRSLHLDCDWVDETASNTL